MLVPFSNHLRIRARKPLVALVLIAAIIFGSASPAFAHTSLLESIPDNRSSLSSAPDQITLVFAEAVDPRSVQLDIMNLDGEVIDGAVRTTADTPDSEVITFSIPALDAGVYGFPWVTVGPDGHRVAGEVVVGVAVEDVTALEGATFSSTPVLDRVLQIVNAIARFGWYVGLSVVAGALFVLWVFRRQLDDEHDSRGAVNHTWSTALRWLGRGWKILLGAQLLRTVATLWLIARGFASGQPTDDFIAALNTSSGVAGVLGLALVFLLSLVWPLVGAAKSSSALTTPLLAGAAGLFSVIALAEVNSHTAVLSDTALGIAIATVHVAGAVIWFGPLAVVALTLLTNRFGKSSVNEHVLGPLYSSFAPWAFGSFIALALTGVRATWINAGWDLMATGYGRALIAKLVLIAAVVLPLGLYHDRKSGLIARRLSGDDEARALNPPSPGFGRIEAGALAGVLAIAAVLTSLNPLAGATADTQNVQVAAGADGEAGSFAGAELLSGDEVTDINLCLDRTVGQSNCYRDYFSWVMREKGADVAVAEVDAAQVDHPLVAYDCHQVVHDIGNEAADYYGDIGVALSYEGSACWSGYYHGVVENALSQYSDEELLGQIARVCDVAAAVPYNFTHYNCLHGVGHGVMLRLNSDLFTSIPYCEKFEIEWEKSSCLGGAFMENVVSAQQIELNRTEGIYSSETEPTLSDTDLVYPCNAVEEKHLEECWGMQTSWILWKNGRDYAGAFEICDGVTEGYVDDCYRSMGRDISGDTLVDPPRIRELCDLGAYEWQPDCYVGATVNAVFNFRDTVIAWHVCNLAPEEMQFDCFVAMDDAAATL